MQADREGVQSSLPALMHARRQRKSYSGNGKPWEIAIVPVCGLACGLRRSPALDLVIATTRPGRNRTPPHPEPTLVLVSRPSTE
jgi:hypothetical protein